MDKSKSKVIFMCGPAGSGKSTFAKRFELDKMTILSFDKESYRRGLTMHPLPQEIHDEIKSDLDDELKELLEAGRDVVLDYSFWSKEMRREYISLLQEYKVTPQIYYIKTPRDVILKRIVQRKGTHPNDIVLTQEMAALYFDHFQPPTSDEGTVITVEGDSYEKH